MQKSFAAFRSKLRCKMISSYMKAIRISTTPLSWGRLSEVMRKNLLSRTSESYDPYKEPTVAVCARHSVTPGNLYKIVSVAS